MKKKFGISIASAIAMTLLIVSTVIGMSMGGLDGVWEFVEDGGNNSAACDAWATGEGSTIAARSNSTPSIQTNVLNDENQVRYGNPDNDDSCPNNHLVLLSKVVLVSRGLPTSVPSHLTPLSCLGRAAHYNNPIYVSNNWNWVDLDVTISGIMCGGGITPTEGNSRTYVYRVNLDETPNTGTLCLWINEWTL